MKIQILVLSFLIVGCLAVGAVRVPTKSPVPTPTPTSTPTTTNWVNIETFNEPGCPRRSSIGGIAIQSGLCYKNQIITCSGSKIVLSSYSQGNCSGTPTSTKTYSSGSCLLANVYDFTKTYSCAEVEPAIPERSLVISVFDGCEAVPSNLLHYRWIPTYKCMPIQRYQTSASSISSSSSGSGSGSGVSSSSASSTSGTGGSGAFVQRNVLSINDDVNHHQQQQQQQKEKKKQNNAQNHEERITPDNTETKDYLDAYWLYLDRIAGIESNKNIYSEVKVDDELDNSYDYTGTATTGLISSGFATGTGGSGTGSYSESYTSASLALVMCNTTTHVLFQYSNGAIMSGTAGSIMSTGEYTSGDPMGSNMYTGYTGTGAASGGTPANGCSMMPSYGNAGTNSAKCDTTSNKLYVSACMAPFHK